MQHGRALSKKTKIAVSATLTVALMWAFMLLTLSSRFPIQFAGSAQVKFDLMNKTLSDLMEGDKMKLAGEFFEFFRALIAVFLIPLVIGGFIAGGAFNFEKHGWKSASKNTVYGTLVFVVSLAAATNTFSPFGPATIVGLLAVESFTIVSVSSFFYFPTGIAGLLAEKTAKLLRSEPSTKGGGKGKGAGPGGRTIMFPPSLLPNPITLPKGYKMIRHLGSGGFADVVLAHDGKKEVVLKIVKGTEEEKQAAIAEARNQYSIKHRNIVQVYDIEINPPCIVEEFCDGGNLWDQVRSRSMTQLVRLVMSTGRGIGNALWVMHRKGFVHLDIKPENILFKQEGQDLIPKLSDFGTAKRVGDAGSTVGTKMYLPPSYQPPVDVDTRLDIYQLGVSLYFVLAVQALGNLNKTDLEALKSAPVDLSNRCPEMPPELDVILRKAISVNGRDFTGAYATAEEFANAFSSMGIK